MPSITEVLMAPGQWSLDLDWDPEIVAELISGRHILVYEGERLAFPPLVITKSHRGGEEGVTVAGQNPYWWLGQDNDGSVIADRWYLSGKSRLANGDFSLFGADETDPLYWKLAQGTHWAITPGQAAVTADSAKDDVLTSDDPSQAEAAAGQQFQLEVTGFRPTGAGPGHLRGRVVLGGRFIQPDLLAGFDFNTDWVNESEVPGDIQVIDADSMIVGPVTQKQWIANPSFETGDFTGWVPSTGWSIETGIEEVDFSTDPSTTVIVAPRTGSYLAIASVVSTQCWLAPSFGPAVIAGERWEENGYVMEMPVSDGEAKLVLQPINPDKPLSDNVVSASVKGTAEWRGGPFAYQWKQLHIAYDVADGVTGLMPYAYASFDAGGGTFIWDDITLTRTKGNSARIRTPQFGLTPERTYTLSQKLTGSWPISGPSRNGTLHLQVVHKGAGRPDVLVSSSELDVSKASTDMVLTMDLTPPSGYDQAIVYIVATDLLGGNVEIDEKPTLVDKDTATSVVDVVAGPTIASPATFTTSVTAPVGTQSVDAELVVESLGSGYKVTNVSLVRIDQAPATVADIVRDCLKNQITGNPLIGEGAIAGAGTLEADHHVLNQTCRQVLFDISEGGKALPFREHRINPDMTLDFDVAENLFTDHNGTDGTEALIFEPTDIEVQDLPDVEHSDETRVERVVVIGASRPSAHQLLPVQITGEAETSTTEILDWYGNPSTRTRVVSDSSATRPAVADQRATLELDKAGHQQQAVTVRCSDLRARGVDPKPGDWAYGHRPDIGYEDITNPMQKEGRTVFPKRTRVQAKTTECGEDYRFELRRPDGSLVAGFDDLVRKAAATKVELQLGDHVPDFAVDPQGGDAGRQLTNYLKSLAG